MLKDYLLLDSARPFSNVGNIEIGCPEHSSWVSYLGVCRRETYEE